MILNPGDVVLVHGTGWLSRAIRFLEPGPSWTSHCAIAVDSVNIVEALSRGVVERRLDTAYPTSRVRVYRPINIPQSTLVHIARRAEKFVGRPYGFGKLALHALDGMLGGMYVFRRLAFLDRYPICSFVVASAYADEGFHFGVPEREATPDDIHDFVVREREKYERVM